jgi:hypothetical protein
MWGAILCWASVCASFDDSAAALLVDEPAKPATAEAKPPDREPPKEGAATDRATTVNPAQAMAEYNALREQVKHTADAQWRLALWCEDHGLKAEAYVHLAEVVKLDPKRVGAWRRLGFRQYSGHWMSKEQIQELEKQKEADKEWGPRIAKLHRQYHDSKTRSNALEALAKIDEPRAAPSVFRALGSRGAGDQSLAIQILGQIKGQYASKSLALLAVYGATPEVRRRAIETLKGRDSSEFVDLLVKLLVNPLKYEVRPVGGPGSPGVLFVEGERFNIDRVYAPPPPPFFAMRPGDTLAYDEYGLPTMYRSGDVLATQPITPGATAASLKGVLGRAGVAMPGGVRFDPPPAPAGFESAITTRALLEIPIGQNVLLARQAALNAQSQLQNDVGIVRKYNEARKRFNNSVLSVLKEVVDQDPGNDRDAWKKWLAEQKGYVKESKDKPKPVVTELVAFTPQFFTRTGVTRQVELVKPDN